MTSVSLITVEYNSAQHTAELLLSLEKVNVKDIQLNVVIVHNGSKQISEHTSQKLSIKNLISEKNLGFTGGNNLGIDFALHEYNPDFILLLNNDTLVDPNFLRQLLSHAQNHPRSGIISPLIYFAKGYEFHSHNYAKDELGRVVWFAGGSIDWQNMYGFHRGVDEVDRGQFQSQQSKQKKQGKQLPYVGIETMDFATGCCMLIPTKVLKKVGVFDDSYFLYWEDVELSYRVRQAGYELTMCEDSKVWHKNAGSSGGSGSKLHQYYQERNRRKFAWKYAPWRTRVALLREYLITHNSFFKTH